jgi:hypothetical protein
MTAARSDGPEVHRPLSAPSRRRTPGVPDGTAARCRPALPPRPPASLDWCAELGEGEPRWQRSARWGWPDDAAVARRSRAERSKLRRELGTWTPSAC